MKISCDGFKFEFPDALDVFVFDQQDSTHPRFHGLSHAMKAVDLVVELADDYLFIEVKDFRDQDDLRSGDGFKNLKHVLKYKFRDTFVYRWAEDLPQKSIRYVCMLSLRPCLETKVDIFKQ